MFLFGILYNITLFSDAFIALTWTTRLLAFSALLNSAEMLARWPLFRDQGVLGWPWLRTKRGFLQHKCVAWVCAFPNFLVVLALRMLGALLLLAWPIYPFFSGLAVASIFVSSLLISLRNFPYGVTGAHRMTTVISGALLLYHVVPDSLVVAQGCLWFIAGQACLSYATAGWIKLKDPAWRNGTALFQTVNVPMTGTPPWLAKILHQHPRLAKISNWFTVMMEGTFPLVLLIGHPFHFIYLGWGVLFHAAIALLLGLNHFFWVWLATYPAILYVSAQF